MVHAQVGGGTLMRTLWFGIGLLVATAVVLAGCAHHDPMKPPKRPEEYKVPPTEDARFSQPPKYPKDVLNTDRSPGSSSTPGAPGSLNGPRMSKPGGPGAGSY